MRESHHETSHHGEFDGFDDADGYEGVQEGVVYSQIPGQLYIAAEPIASPATTKLYGTNEVITQDQFLDAILRPESRNKEVTEIFTYWRPKPGTVGRKSAILNLSERQLDIMYALAGCSDVMFLISRVSLEVRQAVQAAFDIDKQQLATWFKNRGRNPSKGYVPPILPHSQRVESSRDREPREPREPRGHLPSSYEDPNHMYHASQMAKRRGPWMGEQGGDDFPSKMSRRGPPPSGHPPGSNPNSYMGGGGMITSMMDEGNVLSQIADHGGSEHSSIARQLSHAVLEIRQQQVNIAQNQLLIEKRQMEQAEREKETQRLQHQLIHQLQMHQNQLASMGASSAPQLARHLSNNPHGMDPSSGYGIQSQAPQTHHSYQLTAPPPRSTYEQRPQQMTMPQFSGQDQVQGGMALHQPPSSGGMASFQTAALIPPQTANQWGGGGAQWTEPAKEIPPTAYTTYPAAQPLQHSGPVGTVAPPMPPQWTDPPPPPMLAHHQHPPQNPATDGTIYGNNGGPSNTQVSSPAYGQVHSDAQNMNHNGIDDFGQQRTW